MRFDVKSSLVSAFVVAVIALPCPVLAEDGKSRVLATDLVTMMAERKSRRVRDRGSGQAGLLCGAFLSWRPTAARRSPLDGP